jgi:hypothetical protein
MKAIGVGSAAVGGAVGAIAGIKQGGAQGVATAAGSLSGATGAILSIAGVSGPLAPILMGVGLGLGFVSQLFGDPKQKRQHELEDEAARRGFTDPTGTAYDVDIYGRRVDYNTRGDARPIVVNIKAIDAKSFIDRAEDIGAAVRVAVNSYPPLMAELRGALQPA